MSKPDAEIISREPSVGGWSPPQYKDICWNNTALPIGTKLYAIPDAPPECKTEAEKTAFAFGWLKALESKRNK